MTASDQNHDPDENDTADNGHPGGQDPKKAAGLDDPDVALPATVERNERIVREGFWEKLRRFAGHVPFVEELVAAYFCAMDPKTPWRVKAVLLAALAYFIMPVDLIPDLLVGVGLLDDAGVIYAAVRMVSDHITDEHRAKAREALLKETRP